jgi:putative methionine-R-sulfoxide reductase with GAF domain
MRQTNSRQRLFLERNLLPISIGSLLLIAVVLGGGYLLTQQQVDQQENDTRLVNIASRQRMLSQQISKNAALIGATEATALRASYVNELSDGLQIWRESHEGLRFGDDELNLPGDNSNDVETLFAAIQPNYEAMLTSGQCLVALERGQVAGSGCNDNADELIATILANESAFLNGMNRIVFQYDNEITRRVNDTEDIQSILIVVELGVVVFLVLFVFIPMGRATGSTIGALQQTQDELETRGTELQRLQAESEARSRNLQAVINLSERVSTVMNLDQILRDITDISRDNFELYQAHIYLIDETGETLRLVAGAGYIGEQMVSEGRTISLSNPDSIVARAGRAFDNVVVNDVRESGDFLPHPLLPNTQSEMAIALLARGQLIGVLDLQSDQTNFFTTERIVVMEAVAAQVATAISNATLFASLQRITAHERALGNITRTVERATTVEEILQTTVREIGKALRVPHTAIELQLQQPDTLPNGKRTE